MDFEPGCDVQQQELLERKDGYDEKLEPTEFDPSLLIVPQE